ETKLSTLELARHLILLKGALKEQEEAQQNANAMQNGEARQKKMGQRAKRAMGQGQSLSESQKGYLREMAREQAAIRSLMEAAKARMEEKGGSGKNGNENGGQNQAGSEALKSMEKLIESMKRAEEGLQNATEKDRERIVSQQKEIEENLLKFNKGIRDRKDEEKNERDSNTAKNSFDGTTGKIDESLLYFQERLGKLRGAKYFPPGYEARMRAYLEKLREKKGESGPTGPVR
ncbi:MAG: hypothetical protein JNM63_04560, partial [Spirochaetia bacterium]|nr:hypothetical protein [Spirochaetia bacterium]